ncbi:hypothetical protein PanWU01x14_129850 [Parasponia andersonii]|uniref:Uncharacterized protein n=1 Tax=Parasponia andersonii TaxID=3476 RepID=A0A2P5CRJ6_PARAD|nr:hypothetical protein PanWU01x14_129850 [Parasponia andersonii]
MPRSPFSVEFDAANSTWLSNDVVLLSTKSGELLVLTLVYDGRAVVKFISEVLQDLASDEELSLYVSASNNSESAQKSFLLQDSLINGCPLKFFCSLRIHADPNHSVFAEQSSCKLVLRISSHLRFIQPGFQLQVSEIYFKGLKDEEDCPVVRMTRVVYASGRNQMGLCLVGKVLSNRPIANIDGLQKDMMPSCDTSVGVDNSEPVCVQIGDELTMGVLQLKDSGIHGDVAEEVGAIDVKGGVNDSLINKGKYKVFEGGVSSKEMFSTEDTMALGKIFKDNLMSTKNIGPMGAKGVLSAKRHFKRHSAKKPDIVMSPKHAKFFNVQSPHKPRKVGTPKNLDLNAKVSGDSLGTKRKKFWLT